LSPSSLCRSSMCSSLSSPTARNNCSGCRIITKSSWKKHARSKNRTSTPNWNTRSHRRTRSIRNLRPASGARPVMAPNRRDVSAAARSSYAYSLFATQRFHRVRHGRPHRQDAHGHQRNTQRQDTRKHEDPPAERNAIGIAHQPPVHGKIRDRPRNRIGQQYQMEEMSRQQRDDAVDRSAHDLADTDLLHASLRGIRRQTEQAETGDEDRQPGQDTHDLADLFIASVNFVEMIVEELVFQRMLGKDLSPGLLDKCNRLIGLSTLELYRYIREATFRAIEEEHRLDLVVQRIEIEILRDPDNMPHGVETKMPSDEPLPGSSLLILEQFIRQRFIDDVLPSAPAVPFSEREIASRYQLYLIEPEVVG